MKPECSANEMEVPDPQCPVTLWSDWGPCSVSCGSGVRIRARQLLVEGEAARHCLVAGRKVLSEQQPCSVRTDCVRDAAAQREACAQPMEVGPCRGSYERYAYDAERSQCGRFMYGGCRGNANNFLTETECRRSCHANGDAQESRIEAVTTTSTATVVVPIADELTSVSVDCQLTNWSEWSRCSVVCGMGIAERSRRILAEARNGGKVCPTNLVKRRRCYKGAC